MRILGIDPSLNRTGWAIVDYKNNKYTLVEYGYIECKDFDAESQEDEKLEHIYKTMEKVYKQYKPEYVISESPFYSKNVKTLMRLSHVHGTLLLIARQNGKKMDYYSPLTIKSVVLKGLKTKDEDGNKKTGTQMKKEVEKAVFDIIPKTYFKKDYTDDVIDAVSVVITFVMKDGKGTLRDNKEKEKEKNKEEKPKKTRKKKGE